MNHERSRSRRGSSREGPEPTGQIEPLVAALVELLPDKRSEELDRIKREHPDLSSRIEKRLRNLDELGLLEEPSAPPLNPIGFGLSEGQRFGDYRILQELGRGGQGVIYLALDTRLNRRVALKFLSPALVGSDELLRFRREGRLVSKIDHPGICTIFEIGETGGVPFLAMQYVEGETLQARLRRQRRDAVSIQNPSTTRSTLELFSSLARALHVAHEHGLIHRDIKPSNLVINSASEPVILDFGLGRDETSESLPLTRTGEIMGTPAYMSPEQIEPQPHRPPDRRTDVYSLGITLYECLTLRPPFEGVTREALYRNILTREPVPAHRMSTHLSRDISAVLETALSKNRDHRYETSLAFAQDLDRIRRGEAPAARRAGPITRLSRFCARNPAAPTFTALLILLLTSGLLLTLNLLDRSQRTLTRMLGQNLCADSHWVVEKDPGLSLRLAIEGATRDPGLLANNALLKALDACREEKTIPHPAPVNSVSIDEGGRLLLTACNDGKVRLLDIESGLEIRSVTTGDGEVQSARFSPDHRWIAGHTKKGRLHIWDGDLETKLQTLGTIENPVTCYAIPQGENRLLVGRSTGLYSIHPLTGATREVPELSAGIQTISHAASTDDFVTRNDDDSLSVIQQGEIKRRIRIPGIRPRSVSMSPDGSSVVATFEDNVARLFRRETRWRPHFLSGHTGEVHDGFPSPNSAFVVTVSRSLVLSGSDAEDDAVRIYPTKTGALAHRLETGVGSRLHGFGPQGFLLVSRSSPEELLVYDLENDAREILVLKGHREAVSEARFTPDGSRIVSASRDGTVRVWRVGERRGFPVLRGHTQSISPARFSSDETKVVTASQDGTARVFDPTTGEPLAILAGHESWVYPADFDVRGDRVVTASWDGTARIWDALSGETLHTLPSYDHDRQAAFPSPSLQPVVFSAGFSPDGTSVATASWDGTARVFDANTGSLLHSLAEHEDQLYYATFNRSGTRLATTSEDGTVRVWDLATGEPHTVLRGHEKGVFRASFVAGDEKILTTSFDGTARLFDGNSGNCLVTLTGHERTVYSASLNASGTKIATGSADRTARVWDARSGKELVRFRNHSGQVSFVDFHPDGQRVVTASQDGTARVFLARNGEEILTLDHSHAVSSARFNRRGDKILTSAGRTARLWPVDPLAVALQAVPRGLTEGERFRYITSRLTEERSHPADRNR